jgi:cell division protein FtsL
MSFDEKTFSSITVYIMLLLLVVVVVAAVGTASSIRATRRFAQPPLFGPLPL